ncbi:MAG: coproporphyrinogen III oxidase [Alphaproteobacteria bacterium]|nr:coproporphyrinogen III oxidase [Alphaproteobacteria bacterium]
MPVSGADRARPGDIAIYLHWPFCAAKCPYCDFNVHIRASIDDSFWRQAFLAELDAYFERVGPRTVSSVYFGGGTPSLMNPATIGSILDRIATHWSCGAATEVSLEANPNDRSRFAALQSAGITRLSLGVQAFDDDALRFLGRDHDARDASEALDKAGQVFPRASFDLIYARPGQSVAAWQVELKRALAVVPGHVSLYQLTIERGTAFFDSVKRGAFAVPDSDLGADFFEVTQELCAGVGLPAYEISNHARSGEECRYNLTCWLGGDYVGIGPGAHGRISEGGIRHALRAFRKPETWAARVAEAGLGLEDDEVLGHGAAIEEAVMMALRTVHGLDRAFLRSRFDAEIESCVNRSRLKDFVDDGKLECDERGLRATAAGRIVLDAIIGALLA